MKKTLLIVGIVLDIVISLIILFGCTPAKNQSLTENQNQTSTNDFNFKWDRIVVGTPNATPTIVPSEPTLVG
ncbi:MAG: hypothetical protein ACLRFR_02500 [Clostridia bacterium]